MSDKRNLRIFCPIHEASFEVVENPKILCEITGHSLSTGFPDAEFWEFCCNCATYSPSGLGKGEKTSSYCFSCQNEISKRFVCSNCKTLSFECGTKSKGQSYFISDNGAGPACPGCGAARQNGKVVRHDCDDIGAQFFTAHEICPFCLESTEVGFVRPHHQTIGSDTVVCPNCHVINPASMAFCGKCRFQLRDDVAVERLGSDISRTQSLGSLCPNCSTPIPSNSDFCGECGQLKEPTGAVHAPGSVAKNPRSNTAFWLITGTLALAVAILATVVWLRPATMPASGQNSTPSPQSNPAVNTLTQVDRSPAVNSRSDPPPTPAVSPAGQWTGNWSTTTGAYYHFVLTVDGAGERISGHIRWTLERTPRPDKMSMVGVSAIEYVSGHFDLATRQLIFAGTRKDDPNDLLVMLDQYRLTISSNGRSMSGVARNGGKWNGKISLAK